MNDSAIVNTHRPPDGNTHRFPDGFLWGASTAGHQIEGNNVNSDLWLMENLEPKTFAERSGDACDSYHRGADDIALMTDLGLGCYRFSVEWARIEPTPGEFSRAELDHYRRFVDALRTAGILPIVTYFHAAAPRWFAEAGGWLSDQAADRFAAYCQRVTEVLGDGIAYACTINEPQVGITYRVFAGGGEYFVKQDELQGRAHLAAARATGSERFVTMNHPDVRAMQTNLMAAHEQGVDAIKAVRPNLPTGVTLNLVDFQPANEGSPHAEMREQAYGPWLEVVARSGGFVGVQTYRQIRIPGSGAAVGAYEDLPFVDPADLPEVIKQPTALRNTVEYVHARTGKPVLVSENGLETDDDARRAWYIPRVLGHLAEAIESGVPVIGYCYWSLLDNFEWLQGFGPKFGLASVDRSTFTRTLKPSAAVYREIVRTNVV